ncbi:putative FBD-associated F-box protein At3g50710 [Brassica napus]|uniref:putative FBD-associated F-box protein At3g50710 n=1 Tax=Brassica napus TaxID=3708 RepID=UPI00207868D9|nr:putative FBD-associated F-box protein At3g50710 [Brassica napus]
MGSIDVSFFYGEDPERWVEWIDPFVATHSFTDFETRLVAYGFIESDVMSWSSLGFLYMDKISSLSDDLLLKILSSLCTKDVLSTMFFSKRWKFLWTMVPKLDFEHGTSCYDDTKEEYTRFCQYVDRIAIARRMRELEINRYDVDKSFELPAFTCCHVSVLCPWQCRNVNSPVAGIQTQLAVVVLKLYKSILVYGPDDLVVSLSSLKTLHLLCVEYENEESHRRLLRGCPVLEELVVDKTDNWSVRSSSVVMPSLERLSVLNQYRDYEAYTDKLEHESYNDRVTINVPSLKYLNYVDIIDYGHLYLSEDMPELVEAHVKLVCKNHEKLMRSLTAVKRLSLCLFNHSMVQHRIGFDQLVHLELCGCSPKWWDLLTWILKSSPKLQVLKLNQVHLPCPAAFGFFTSPFVSLS